MQTMLNCMLRKNTIIKENTAKFEVVHFNSSGSNVPVFNVGRVPLAHKDSFKYLGMLFNRRMSMSMIKGKGKGAKLHPYI
jgi:hypothetical protein